MEQLPSDPALVGSSSDALRRGGARGSQPARAAAVVEDLKAVEITAGSNLAFRLEGQREQLTAQIRSSEE